jgi:hypothetical protein
MYLRLNYRALLTAFALVASTLGFLGAAQAQSTLSPNFAATGQGLSASARVGREIWFFATAFNDRFYTYSYPQRLGAVIDWYRILGAKNRRDLFQAWGATPDPDCCIPGDANCPARSLDETYGFPWCPGDSALLRFVGREGYRDPACELADAPFDNSTPHGAQDQRQSACDLMFGTSTGALGLRKFPNPRFDAAKWRRLNGSLDTWEGYSKFLSSDRDTGDSRINRLFDGSIEPPFRIGMSCGACHISYDPLRPPADANNPKWENIDGLVGNQYSRVSQMLGSGLSQHRLEWQLIARTRPGTVDTSALPMDTISNPGTMNAIINFGSRPTHQHRVLKWRKASACRGGNTATCWCEPEKAGKCWQRSETTELVHNILKGGEDSIGAAEAIQRVYFNIGSAAEQCWLNHVPDLRAVDPAQRNYGQTPFDIGQCRRDSASFRAIEDRLGNLVDFFFTARPADLYKARGLASVQELQTLLDREFGDGSVALGRQVFARTCAGCHSSQSPPFETRDFHATDPGDPTRRIDFLSHERPLAASQIGTYAGRALHSNHMPSRVWDQYASRTLHERAPDAGLKEIMKGSSRGYYRPASLLSVWAYAPFMHNNAIGPEVCGKPSSNDLDFYSSPYVDAADKPLASPPTCVPFDPSVDGRYRLFKSSMEELLYPDRRLRKVNLVDEDIIVDIAPQVSIGRLELGLSVKLPKGSPAILINSLRYKDLIQDLIDVRSDPDKLETKYSGILSSDRMSELKGGLGRLRAMLIAAPARFTLDLTGTDGEFIQNYYSNALGRVENSGHRFGENLSDREKRALIAFLATF